MGDLLESLDRRFEEQYAGDLWPKDRLVGWEDVHLLIGRAFQPRSEDNGDLHPDGVYARWSKETVKGVLEMFKDVYQSTLDTMPIAGGYNLVIEPHLGDREPTRIVITYGDKVLYTNHRWARHFDFDNSHMLEVFMRSIRDTVRKNLEKGL